MTVLEISGHLYFVTNKNGKIQLFQGIYFHIQYNPIIYPEIKTKNQCLHIMSFGAEIQEQEIQEIQE